jgi:hypothetical protein
MGKHTLSIAYSSQQRVHMSTYEYIYIPGFGSPSNLMVVLDGVRFPHAN